MNASNGSKTLFNLLSFAIVIAAAMGSEAAPAASTESIVIKPKVIVNCPRMAGVKTYADGAWSGVDHPNTYPLKSNRVEGNWIGCTYAGPQNFNFDISPVGLMVKNCVVKSLGTFQCDSM